MLEGLGLTMPTSLFYTHLLCINYIIAMRLLVRCISSHNRVLYFSRFCGESTPKIASKNRTKNFARFQNHSPLLAMVLICVSVNIFQRATNYKQTCNFFACSRNSSVLSSRMVPLSSLLRTPSYCVVTGNTAAQYDHGRRSFFE